MKQSILELAYFQKWANDRFRANLEKLDYPKLSIMTPYGPIKDFIIHIFGGIELWLKRLEGISLKEIRSSEIYYNWKKIEKDWIEFDNKLIETVKKFDENEFSTRIRYTSTEGKNLEITLENILLQLVTHHQSYHRGQIAMALRLQKLPPVQETDYIYYVYDQKHFSQ